LSTVWGASLGPYCAKDISAWPIGITDLEPHYRAVLEFVPSTGEVDELEGILPTYTDKLDPLQPSQQAQRLITAMRANREKLTAAGIHFGTARVAIAASGDAKRKACNYCGLCLYGCPYSLIYSSASTLADLIEAGKITYLDDHVVEKLVQSGDTVTIHAKRVSDSADVTFEGERVFVGAGVLPTAYIMLNSLEAYDTPVEIIDSQYFIYPFFQFKRTIGIQYEKAYGTAQVYLEIDHLSVSKNLVHMEVFGYSDFVKNAMLETPLRFLLRNQWVANQFFGRLFVLQCFMHSDDSSRLIAKLSRPAGESRPKLSVRPLSRFWSVWTSLKAGIKLALNAFRIGGIVAVPGLQFAGAGRSYHSGGTFPMSANPSGFQTDKLGRVSAMDRVHIVDASVFPSIPATTITLTVMANAHRIATEAMAL
jgi:choline dehydrogenase-like flavoprotein